MQHAADLGDRLEKCYSGAVYDVLRASGLPDQVLPTTLRPLDPDRVLAGEVFTVSGHVDLTLDPHATLLAWTGLLSKAPRNSVIICQPNDSTLAHMGELSSETLTLRGVRGYIVDGGCRDSALILRTGFPVWCRYFTPRDVVGRWVADATGDPIEIGGVVIETGDHVLADREKVEQVLATENKVRTAILQGIDPVEAYLRHGKF